MEFTLTNLDATSAKLVVNVVEADYAAQVEKTLKNFRQKANIPGFRPGMVPMGLIKKQYGTAVKAEEVNKLLQQKVYEYIRENGFLKPDQIAALKNTPNLENVTQYTMIQILNSALPEAKVSGKVTLSEKKLDKYFPPHFSAVQREKVIIGLLEEWQSRKDGE